MRMRTHQAIIAALFLSVSMPALAFDPATDHTCVYNCGGGLAPSGGGYVAPAPSGPSPAEIARRKRINAGNAANDRGSAARQRGDLAAAVRYFEEAARLWPEDQKIQGNYWNAKGELAEKQGDPASAVTYYRKALRYYPNNKDIAFRLKGVEEKTAVDRGDWDSAAKMLGQNARIKHYYLGRQAIEDKDWDKAIGELKEFKPIAESMVAHGRKAVDLFVQAERAFLDAHAPQEAAKNRKWLADAKNRLVENEKLLTDTDRYLKTALAGKANQDEAKKAEAQKQADEQRREQASNPNYPNPPPVYRDANTPRSYPDLASYTPAQHSAHNDNDTGNTWAQKGDWVQALLSYQKALVEDPDGPFAKVIKENLDIAMKHLKDNQPKSAAMPAQPEPAKPVQASQTKPEEIADSNCTRWSTASGVSSRMCMDAQQHHYCEQADGKGAVSRVVCQ